MGSHKDQPIAGCKTPPQSGCFTVDTGTHCPQGPALSSQEMDSKWPGGDWRVLVSGTQLTLLLAITLPGQEPWEDRPQTCSSPESNSTAPKSSAVSSQQPSFCSHTHLLLSGAPSTALRRLSSHQPGCETNLAFPSASQAPSTHERPLKCATLTLIIFTIIY